MLLYYKYIYIYNIIYAKTACYQQIYLDIEKNSSYFYNLYKPVLADWQTLLTVRAQESQKSLSFAIGHLSLHASFQYRQMYCTNVDVSSRDQFSGFLAKEALFMFAVVSVSLLNNDRLDFPSTCRLFVGLPGVLPSTTLGLFAAMLNHPVNMSAKHVTFKSIKSDFPEGSAGERSNIL